VPLDARRALWERIATDLRPLGLGEDLTEVDLPGLPAALDAILASRTEGRTLVRIGA
jgi:hypothetical protein